MLWHWISPAARLPANMLAPARMPSSVADGGVSSFEGAVATSATLMTASSVLVSVPVFSTGTTYQCSSLCA